MSEASTSRAAQFLPFAALSGYAEMVREAEREAEKDGGRPAHGEPSGEKSGADEQGAGSDAVVNWEAAGVDGSSWEATGGHGEGWDDAAPRQKGPHTLAGTNGVPLRSERTYLRVVCETSEEGETRPLEVVWPDGRRFKVVSSSPLRDLGRWERGTKVLAWEVTFRRRNRSETRRIIWWERGRWFARRIS